MVSRNNLYSLKNDVDLSGFELERLRFIARIVAIVTAVARQCTPSYSNSRKDKSRAITRFHAALLLHKISRHVLYRRAALTLWHAERVPFQVKVLVHREGKQTIV